MSLLSIIQRVARGTSIPVPTVVIGNTDRQIIQLLEMAQEEGEDLASRTRWSRMTLENTFTQVAAADQGLLNSAVVAAGDFDYVLNDTMWNRDTSLPILGSLNAVDWQTLQAFPVTGPYQQYKIEGGHLYFDPVGANATDTIAFHYKSTSWCESSGGTGQALWAADNDVGRLDETIMRLGIRWRWRKEKGLEYAQDFDVYENRILDSIGRDGGAPRLTLAGGVRHRLPGVMVPLGSWSVS
jgi:hypothetical protein